MDFLINRWYIVTDINSYRGRVRSLNLFFSAIIKMKNAYGRDGVDMIDGWDLPIREILQPSDIMLCPAIRKEKNNFKIYIDQEKKSAEIN